MCFFGLNENSTITTTTIIPVVLGHSGVVLPHQQYHLKRIPFYKLFHNLQKAALSSMRLYW